MKLGKSRGHIQSNWQDNFFKEIRRENFEKSIVEKGSLLPTNDHIETGTKVRATTKFELYKVSIEDTYRASGKKILKEIRREKFEKSIVEKGSLLPTNDHIETGTKVRSPGNPE